MRHQQLLAKARMPARGMRTAARTESGFRFERYAGDRSERRQQLRRKRERDQSGPGRDDPHPELLGEAITERRGAELRHREPAGGDHDRFAAHSAVIGDELEPVLRLRAEGSDAVHRAWMRPLHAGPGNGVDEEIDHLP